MSFGQVAGKASENSHGLEVQKYFDSGEAVSQGSISAVVAHVQVDLDTEQIILRKITTALTEEVQFNDGCITTLNLGEYKLPNCPRGISPRPWKI